VVCRKTFGFYSRQCSITPCQYRSRLLERTT